MQITKNPNSGSSTNWSTRERTQLENTWVTQEVQRGFYTMEGKFIYKAETKQCRSSSHPQYVRTDSWAGLSTRWLIYECQLRVFRYWRNILLRSLEKRTYSEFAISANPLCQWGGSSKETSLMVESIRALATIQVHASSPPVPVSVEKQRFFKWEKFIRDLKSSYP